MRDIYSSVHNHLLVNLPESLPKDELEQARFIKNVILKAFEINEAIHGMESILRASPEKYGK
ncbi:MAG: hypothetical protein ABIF85_02575 [Nanoarchaeota archaeon]|nr:hypothetical protein [Nanoarchaeota archaeon]